MRELNPYAVQLGRMGAGKKKTMSVEAIRQRREAGFKRQSVEKPLPENSSMMDNTNAAGYPIFRPKRKRHAKPTEIVSEPENKVADLS